LWCFIVSDRVNAVHFFDFFSTAEVPESGSFANGFAPARCGDFGRDHQAAFLFKG
jgi:hypothetical protein